MHYCAIGENERLMRRDMVNHMVHMLKTSGVKSIEKFDNGHYPGMRIQELGKARMDHDPNVIIDDAKKDNWGLLVLKIDCAIGANDRLMRRDMLNDLAEMLEASGVQSIEKFDNRYYPGMGIHEMGTARMGRDPKTSVL